MNTLTTLAEKVTAQCGKLIVNSNTQYDQFTIEVAAEHALQVFQQLRDTPELQFDMLIDLCGVDYAQYGIYEWDTQHVTVEGFSRGVTRVDTQIAKQDSSRFAVVYHLLSTVFNQRIRVRIYCDEQLPIVDSVITIWNAANWFEREAYDLF